MIEFYSAREFNSLFIVDGKSWLEKRGSVGRAIIGTPHILDELGNELPLGEIGQVWIESGGRFEYYGEPEKNTAAFNDKSWSIVKLSRAQAFDRTLGRNNPREGLEDATSRSVPVRPVRLTSITRRRTQ